MKYGNLTVIGTSHIAKDSVSRVKEAILAEKPDIVAVELDHARLHVMLSGQKPRFSLSIIKVMGMTGTLFFLIGNFLQRKLGKMIGASPGEEMKAAVELARQNGTRVALIDQPFNITMGRISGISLTEKLKLVRDLLFGMAGIDNEKMNVKLDLTKVPPESFVRMAMKKVKERYPQLYKALVTDRDNYMANMLARIIKMEPQSRIVAVVGAGHERELIRLVKKQAERSI
ncbi:TraB/GumN family protein [Candidatus Woesearchaeota archaeon]|nr:TraB/GumN family protein [Candidatus Woesearchaeota archaeon]